MSLAPRWTGKKTTHARLHQTPELRALASWVFYALRPHRKDGRRRPGILTIVRSSAAGLRDLVRSLSRTRILNKTTKAIIFMPSLSSSTLPCSCTFPLSPSTSQFFSPRFSWLLGVGCSSLKRAPCRFTFPNFLGAIQRWRITSIFIVPPIVVGMIKSPLVEQYDLSTLRMGMVGAAPLTEEVRGLSSTRLSKEVLILYSFAFCWE